MKRPLNAVQAAQSPRPPRSDWATALLTWYGEHARDLPWRRTRDPYAIWVSEVMAQQTQIATVLPYYERWMSAFPTVQALAMASEETVLAHWQGLGYYRRARMLHAGAKWVVAHGVPTTAEAWRQVPGVGRYTAGAISSIAFAEAAAVVDGNVERVYARFVGSSASGSALHRESWDWAERVLVPDQAATWNQALMELGARVCRPRNALCAECPLTPSCVALASWRVDELPVRTPRREMVRQQHRVWVPVSGDRFGVMPIPAGQWWEGMWEFPRVVDVDDDEPEALREIVGPGWVEAAGTFRHAVTHHRIEVDVSLVRVESPSPTLRWVTLAELAALPLPAPQRRALKLARARL